ncbi:MAG: M48 family metallopeptidase [Planctomycetota bacterium]
MWEAIAANKRRSRVLIVVLAALLVGLGYLIGEVAHPGAGVIGAAAAGGLWAVLWIVAAARGRKILLGSVGAREIGHDDSPVLFNVVEEMTIAAGLPKPPKVFIIDNDAPNAFAVGGEEESAVAVTTGLLMRLNRDELQGVIAHEIGHITNADTRFMTLAGVMVAAIVIVGDVFLRSMFYAGRGRRRSSGRGKGGGAAILLVVALVFAVLAPIVAHLLYFACSRKREFLADACSARFTRYPPGLAGALEKISAASGKMKKVNRAVAPMFTVNPLKASGAHSLWSTHPPTAERISVLRAMGGRAAYADYESAYREVSGKGLIGKRTLAEDEPTSAREPSAGPEKGGLEKAREALDILHRVNGYLFLSCVCGLKTKVPPSYERDRIRCPRCGRAVPIPAAAAAVAATAEAAGRPETGREHKGRREQATEEEPLTVERKSGQWQSFRCRCGKTIQLSPSFSAPHATCRSCGRRIRVED